jgi:hypothetical protein
VGKSKFAKGVQNLVSQIAGRGSGASKEKAGFFGKILGQSSKSDKSGKGKR